MKSFPGGFAAALAKNSGAPIWILSLSVGGSTYHLSDQGLTIPGWMGGAVVRPWVLSWGQVSEALGLGLAEIRVSDFSATFRNDPAASPNMESLARTIGMEAESATLYLWFAGLDPVTDPPQALFSGFVADVDIPDDARVVITFEDAASRLRGNLGTIVTTDLYPKADPDDIGKILPVVYGSCDRLPAPAVVAGRVTTLTAAIATTTATSFPLLDVTGLAVNDIMTIGSEEIKITAISGATVTVLRGQNATQKGTYAKGTPLFQKMSATPFVFVAADTPVTSLDRVRVHREGIDVDITDLVLRYTGQPGSQYPGYACAVIVIASSSARLIRERIAAALDASTLALDGGVHTHANNSVSQATQIATAPETVTGYSQATLIPTFPSVPGAIVSGVYTYRYTWSIIDGFNNPTGTCTFGSGQTSGGTYNASGSDVPPIELRQTSGLITSCSITLTSATRTVTYTNAIRPATISLSGAVNSVADSEIGGQILVDVTATQSAGLAVVNDLLQRAGLPANATQVGSFPAGYAVNGAILSPRPFIEVINQIAFELRSWFRFVAGLPRLIVRSSTLTSARTIAACAVDAEFLRLYSRKKTPVDDVINTITLRYGRDYTVASGEDAYTLTSSAVDSASVSIFGPRQKDELFCCDFITSEAMAASVRDFYLGRYKGRGWEHRFSLFLDYLPVEFGDAVTLAFAGGIVGEVMESRFTPGQESAIDRIDFMIEELPMGP